MEGNLLQQLFNYYVTNFGYLWDLFFKHLLMSVYGVLFAALIGIPLGILLARYTKLSGFVITIANIIQTVPVIAMLAILMLVMGLGSETVVLTVFLYALLPIIKNTYTGIASVGIVCKTPATVNTILAVRFVFDNKMPIGTATMMASNNATIEI